MNIKYNIKTLLNSITISISICTIFSVILYYFLGRGSFQLINPYTMDLSSPIYNATISLILYTATGVYFYYFINLVQNDKLGLNKYTFTHFILSIITFSALGFISSIPINAPSDAFASYYTNGNLDFLVLYPIIITLIGYFLTYIIMWAYCVYQTKKLNKVINGHK